MSVSADISLMDILFDRDDPVLKFVDDRDVFKQEFDVLDTKTGLISEKLEPWVTDPDDILKDIFNDEHLNLLEKNIEENPVESFDSALSDWKPVTNDGYGLKEIVVGSSSSAYSDSGLSSDQVSPGLPNDYEFMYNQMDDDDDDDIDDDGQLSSAVSTYSDTSANQIAPSDIKVEPQESNITTATEDEMAVLGIIPHKTQALETGKKKVHQLTNVASFVSSNPRSILLPFSTGNGVKTYKIINSGNRKKNLKTIGSFGNSNPVVLKTIRPLGVPLVLKNIKNTNLNKKMKTRSIKYSNEETDEDEEVTVLTDSENDKVKSQYPRLILSPEEKKLIQKEGVRLPSHYPLTKFEERELKRIRRKIRNKISAQDSRKRKKEYLDGLEDRVKQCTEENLSLMKKIKFLQSQNQSLMAQLKKLQLTLAKTTTKTAQPATCLMVIMLSIALIMAPNLRLTQNNESEIPEQDISENKLQPVAGRTRSLLSKTTPQDACLTSEEEKLSQETDFDHGSPLLNSPYSYMDMDLSTQNSFSIGSERSRKSSIGSMSSGYGSPPHFLADHDYDPPPVKRTRFHLEKFKETNENALKKKFVIPPIDDVWPQSEQEKTNPKEFIIPDIDDKWIPNKSLADKIESLTTEVKVNISDSKGTRTVVIQVPKEKE